jgi:hypothetical protein
MLDRFIVYRCIDCGAQAFELDDIAHGDAGCLTDAVVHRLTLVPITPRTPRSPISLWRFRPRPRAALRHAHGPADARTPSAKFKSRNEHGRHFDA